MKKLLIASGVIVALVIACLFSLDRRVFDRYIEQQIVALGGKAGMNLRFSDLNAGFGGLSASSVDLFLPRAFTMARVDEMKVRPGWLSLLSGNPTIEISGRAYDGPFTSLIRSTYSGDELWLKGSLMGLRFADHPQLSGLGITDGTLVIDGQDLWIRRGVLMSGTLDVQVISLSKPNPTTVPIKVQQFPMNVQIPAVSDLSMKLTIRASEGEVVVEQSDGKSSLFASNGRGALRRDPSGRLVDVEYHGSLALTPEGAKAFGPYLPMMSRGALTEDTTEFEYTVIGDPGRPNTTFRRIR